MLVCFSFVIVHHKTMYIVTSDFVKKLISPINNACAINEFVRKLLVSGDDSFPIEAIELWFINKEDKKQYLSHLYDFIFEVFDSLNTTIVDTLEILNCTNENEAITFILHVNENNPYNDFTIDNITFFLRMGVFATFEEHLSVAKILKPHAKMTFIKQLNMFQLYYKSDVDAKNVCKTRLNNLKKEGFMNLDDESNNDIEHEFYLLSIEVGKAKKVYKDLKEKQQKLIGKML